MPIADIMSRGAVTSVDEEKRMRVVQCTFLAGETRDDLEHFEPYGFTSGPHRDQVPEALAMFFDGDRSHGVVICVADRRYRLNVAAGEVALYDDLKQKVHLTRTGIEMETPLDVRMQVGGNMTVNVDGDALLKAANFTVDCPNSMFTGNLRVQGLITGTGGLTVSGGSGASVIGSLETTGDVTAGGISLQSHTHTEQGDGAETSAAH